MSTRLYKKIELRLQKYGSFELKLLLYFFCEHIKVESFSWALQGGQSKINQ